MIYIVRTQSRMFLGVAANGEVLSASKNEVRNDADQSSHSKIQDYKLHSLVLVQDKNTLMLTLSYVTGFTLLY